MGDMLVVREKRLGLQILILKNLEVTLQNNEKYLENCWKNLGILCVRKSVNPSQNKNIET